MRALVYVLLFITACFGYAKTQTVNPPKDLWRIGGKIHFEENSSSDYIGILEINDATRKAIKRHFDITSDSCTHNAKALIKKEKNNFVIRHYEERCKPGIGEEMHATLLYTSKRSDNGHETLRDIYDNLVQADETLPHDQAPTVEQVDAAYQKIINPNQKFLISDVKFFSGKTGNAIIAQLQLDGQDELLNSTGNPISGNFLHLTLANVDSSVISETTKINHVVSELKEELSGKMIKIGNRNGQIDLEFGVSGSVERVRPSLISQNSPESQKSSDKVVPAKSIEELQKQLEQVLKEMHVPGMSIAIVHREGPELIAGLGQADVASSRIATKETLFRIGSTSKAFTSLAILKLAEEGKLSLDDPIRKLVPEVWFENRWEESAPIRVVHLLEHTTGWDDMHFREYAKEDPNIALREAFDYDHHSRISRWKPGTRMAYCNSGPAVAAYIVEKITGKNFEEYVKENFFIPIGMKTATYFQPDSKSITTLYHNDGFTPYSYWHLIYRPSGAINASANDMATYLLFYLNRGTVNGIKVISSKDLDRMESPATTWSAKEGLKGGYGLGNYWSVQDGFVWHGHNGGLAGDLTEMAYMPDIGIGYFYSINTSNEEAFLKIVEIIRAYMTSKLPKPSVPSAAPLSAKTPNYVGWYELDSPREESMSFLERLLGKAFLHFKDNKLLLITLEGNLTYLPVSETQFRYLPKDKFPDPIPTLVLLSPNSEGQFIQLGLGMQTIKRIPTWLALSEISVTIFVLLSIVSIIIYAPFWLLRGLRKKRRRPLERAMRIWPLMAVLSLISVIAIVAGSSSDTIPRLGNLTAWSFFLFLATLAFAVASIASVIAVGRAPKQKVRRSVQVYSMIVTVALMTATIYLAYWGIIGLRTWS